MTFLEEHHVRDVATSQMTWLYLVRKRFYQMWAADGGTENHPAIFFPCCAHDTRHIRQRIELQKVSAINQTTTTDYRWYTVQSITHIYC